MFLQKKRNKFFAQIPLVELGKFKINIHLKYRFYLTIADSYGGFSVIIYYWRRLAYVI